VQDVQQRLSIPATIAEVDDESKDAPDDTEGSLSESLNIESSNRVCLIV
jgi:hypothetical protein